MIVPLVLAALAATAVPVEARPAAPLQAESATSVELSVEHDDNAHRVAEDPSATPFVDPALPVVGDELLRATLSSSFALSRPRLELRADGAVGVKLFFREAGERMVVGQGQAALSGALPGGLVGFLSTWAKARAQVSGARTYVLARSEAGVGRAILPGFTLRTSIEGVGFHAFDAAVLSAASTSLLLGAAWRVTEQERIDASAAGGARAFPFGAGPAEGGWLARRIDTPVSLSVSATSARALFLSGAWAFTRNTSNASGEAFTRHRLSGIVGFRLPGELTCSVQGALQLTQYDDGVSLGQQYFLGVDDESQNALQAAVSRPLLGGLLVEARWMWTGNELRADGLRFSRATVAIGLRAELER